MSMTSPMSCFSHMLVYIRCNEGVIFNFYRFVAVTIRKSCSMSLMRFNNRIFYILYYFIADFKQFFTMFQSFNVHHWNRFLTKIVNKAYPGLAYTWNFKVRRKALLVCFEAYCNLVFSRFELGVDHLWHTQKSQKFGPSLFGPSNFSLNWPWYPLYLHKMMFWGFPQKL